MSSNHYRLTLRQQQLLNRASQLNEQDQMALKTLINNQKQIDVWRRDHPDSNHCWHSICQ